MDEECNLSMRKYLKHVGVTSQKAIEDALAELAPDRRGDLVDARMVLTLDGREVHVVEGQIKAPSE
jgi:hypothetical protein